MHFLRMDQTSWTKNRIMIGSIDIIIRLAFDLKISDSPFFNAKNGMIHERKGPGH